MMRPMCCVPTWKSFPAVGDEALYHKGNPEVSAYKEYLKDKYGLTEDAIQNYVSGGSGYRYSKNGYGNLWQLYEELEKQLTDTKGRLAENGYDYDRMTGYEQSLVDAEEYRKKQKEWEQYATKHPIASSISSVIMSPFQGLDYLRLGIENVGKNNVNDPENYVPLNVYDMDATNYVSAIRGTVSKNIEKNTDWNLFWSKRGVFPVSDRNERSGQRGPNSGFRKWRGIPHGGIRCVKSGKKRH